jgi:pimeloyl-ACP methyl ester carboxylesterase
MTKQKYHHGDTHVIVSGSKQGVATLVLIHAASANAAMWSPNVAAFSNVYRVYALAP